MSIPDFIQSVCRDIQRGLAKSAIDYANLGLNKFHTTWSPSAANDQIIIGTLAISDRVLTHITEAQLLPCKEMSV